MERDSKQGDRQLQHRLTENYASDRAGGRAPASTTGQADDRGKDNGDNNAIKRLGD